MRKIYQPCITTTDAMILIKKYGNGAQQSIKHANDPIVNRLIEKMSQDFKFTIKEKSYFRVEKMPKGHPWHQDTGDTGHMKWCEVGSSVLLTNSFQGGKTWYATDETLEVTEVADRNILELVAHTSDEWHMVEAHTGDRTVLLMFI